ncbi:nuclear transport factor 2 family protein [Erythrobacter sp.]|uniref:nuclear transport factor 2 family protein n=1 Tax=Erythrobacter sp. TaxID=1042 RepID=UPI001425FAEF|nr:nuclear transport factor 2 family protein [Erythrobacter sp.]QIQ87610.1 MAG: nuclear transport factor 2 family protein [Erythrobacter sp.]
MQLMFTGPIEDRLEIRELAEVYGDGVVRFDKDTWASVWAEDADWDFMGMQLKGRDQIVETWLGAMSNFDAVSFSCVPAAIEVDGNTATSRIQTQEVLKAKDGTTRMIGGLYTDELEKRGGRWVYTKRAFAIVAEYNPQEG